MSHEITIRKDQKAEMAYAGQEPWHGLGQRLVRGASIAEWKVAAGMDWEICRSGVQYGSDDGQHDYDQFHVLYRSDTKNPLSIVSRMYKIMQPGEVLEFFRDLTGDAGFELETAGTLFGGRQFWALASIGESATIVGNDKINGYLLLATSCDGTMKTTAKFVAERVVCCNTLSVAMRERGKQFVRASHRSIFDPAQAKDQLGIARNAWGEFIEYSRELSKISVSERKASEFVGRLLIDAKVAVSKDITNTRQHKKIMELFNGQQRGGHTSSVEGNAWGLVNAVTEFVDHHARAQTTSHKLASAWFGRGDNLKTEVFAQAATL